MNGGKVVYIGEHAPWPSYVCVTRDRGYPESRKYYQRETCTIECNERGCNFAYRLYTLSCGHTVWTMGDAPNYCPSCGRKVDE